MAKVVVDIDDTVINTRHRMHKLWTLLLDRDVPLNAAQTLSLEQIFMKFATPQQKARVAEFQRRFWDLLLCLDAAGLESFALHEPMPYAAEVLQEWSQRFAIAYLTGRTENTRALTLAELAKFGFPTEEAELVMFSAEDYARPKGDDPTGPTLIETRFRRCADLCRDGDVVLVIDDYPGYFPALQQLGIPERVGLLKPEKYSPQAYLERGATRVVAGWKELQDDPPQTL